MDTCFVTAKLTAKKGMEAQLEAEVVKNIPNVRAEKGCIRYDFHKNRSKDGTFLFYEIWESPEALDAHGKTHVSMAILVTNLVLTIILFRLLIFGAGPIPAMGGIGTSVMLGLSRAIGETMAVVMVAGNQTWMPKGLFQGLRTMTSNIVIEMGYAADLHREALIATGVVLFVFILLINLCFSLVKGGEKNG